MCRLRHDFQIVSFYIKINFNTKFDFRETISSTFANLDLEIVRAKYIKLYDLIEIESSLYLPRNLTNERFIAFALFSKPSFLVKTGFRARG